MGETSFPESVGFDLDFSRVIPVSAAKTLSEVTLERIVGKCNAYISERITNIECRTRIRVRDALGTEMKSEDLGTAWEQTLTNTVQNRDA